MSFREFWQPLTSIYPEDEARWIGRFVFEEKYGFSHSDLLMGKETSVDESGLQQLQQRLLTGEPVQYVIGEAPFGERLFKVTPAVLIPRPETLWLCNAVSATAHGCDILDIGTGSGCIAITIALATELLFATDLHGLTRTDAADDVASDLLFATDLHGLTWTDAADDVTSDLLFATDSHGLIRTNSSEVRVSLCKSVANKEIRGIPCQSEANNKITAWDISAEALAVARANAERLKADVTFEQQDILAPPNDTDRWDVIVSNPPYICEQEKNAMERNVLNFEPHLALFVPDNDPLLFYRAIGQYAMKALRPDGRLYLEINPLYANDLCDMLMAQGFSETHIYQDDNQKDRYIVAWKQRNQ